MTDYECESSFQVCAGMLSEAKIDGTAAIAYYLDSLSPEYIEKANKLMDHIDNARLLAIELRDKFEPTKEKPSGR